MVVKVEASPPAPYVDTPYSVFSFSAFPLRLFFALLMIRLSFFILSLTQGSPYAERKSVSMVFSHPALILWLALTSVS
jgi:hypothetical protein